MPHGDPTTQPRRILLVEDDADIRGITELTLRSIGGFEVTACATAEEALGVAPELLPDLVLLDLVLPGMDGGAALRALRGDPRTAAIPVVLFTAWNDERPHVLGAELGAADVLAKTTAPAELCRRLHLALEPRPA